MRGASVRTRDRFRAIDPGGGGRCLAPLRLCGERITESGLVCRARFLAPRDLGAALMVKPGMTGSNGDVGQLMVHAIFAPLVARATQVSRAPRSTCRADPEREGTRSPQCRRCPRLARLTMPSTTGHKPSRKKAASASNLLPCAQIARRYRAGLPNLLS